MTDGLSQQPLRIFVSHSRKDNEFGAQLVEDLRRVLGDETAVWYDVKGVQEGGGLQGGDPWWDRIVEQLKIRNVFLIVLSPNAMTSKWVRREFNIAFSEDKRIIPVLYSPCEVWLDLKTIQAIAFHKKSYEDAFQDLLVALGLSTNLSERISSTSVERVVNNPDAVLVQQITPLIETAFAQKDWPDVLRKTAFLLKRAPVAVSANVYRMQGVALREEGQLQQAQEAFETALALVSDQQQRLSILSEYLDLLTLQRQWSEVIRLVKRSVASGIQRL